MGSKIIKRTLKKIFPGVSWQNPILNSFFRATDSIDYIVRLKNGLSDLPPYSIRIRSNGVNKQFGGRNFDRFGKQLAEYLKKYAYLNEDSNVLEIGCGCGRSAFALSNILANGNYTGMDIEKISLESCRKHPLFTKKRFRFDYLDVQNDEYNPNGDYRADLYKFPYKEEEFDIIFLVSVFTHMKTDDVKNYITEISRMLKPGGTCMITTFLMDKGSKTNGLSFPYKENEHYYYNNSMPEVAIGYNLNFFKIQFEVGGLQQIHDVLWGTWRNPQENTSSKFAQDIIFFTKKNE